MIAQAMKPFGEALLDYFNGNQSADLVIYRDDGYTDSVPVRQFYRSPDQFSRIEAAALGMCYGSVLDAGAGTGCDSLILQDRGMKVCAIDISAEAVEIMKKQGVHDARCGDVLTFSGERFDTILMMTHGIGIVGDLEGFNRFLKHAPEILHPGGQIVCDSLDVRGAEESVHVAYLEENRKAGRYVGEIRLQLEYAGTRGPQFTFLHLDPNTMLEIARDNGWICRIIIQEENGDYLAQLTLPVSG